MKSKFYCDIVGTYDGGKNRKNSLIKFVNLLKKLDNNDELIFSFVSSNNVESVKKCMLELLPYIKDTKIKFGKQYADNKVIDHEKISNISSGKITQICKDLEEENNYDKVYYADDTEMLCFMLQNLINIKFSNIKFQIFTPSNGIECLNKDIENFTQNKKTLNKIKSRKL